MYELWRIGRTWRVVPFGYEVGIEENMYRRLCLIGSLAECMHCVKGAEEGTVSVQYAA